MVSAVNLPLTTNKPTTPAGYQMESVQGSRYQMAPSEKGAFDATTAHNMKDTMLSNGIITKFKVGIEQGAKTPEYMYRGLKGDPDFNFFEFLKVCKFPYLIGGPVLALVYLAGRNTATNALKNSNTNLFKKMALGVALYYAGVELAKMAINTPVKLMRGIDLNHPYKDVVDLREGTPLELPANKKKEYHKVFESCEFTRWDLMYNSKGKNNKDINENYNRLARRFGMKGPIADSDSAVQDKVKKLIIMSTAWKTMLMIPFVTLGIGLAQQDSINNISFRNIINNTKNLFTKNPNKFLTFKVSMQEVGKNIKNGFIELWKGNNKFSGALGKAVILSSIILPVLANTLIFHKTSLSGENTPSKSRRA
ncbi:MAG: hypothetical protein PHX18_04785 [Candidatus Gastranaerophilales bacterium]|nr:hypothetical protein [Candidatus Gastranaerophilales bacterium]